jgi:hypothetical protein
MTRAILLTLLTLATIAYTPCQATDTNTLAVIIAGNLTNSFPALTTQISGSIWYIAQQAAVATNYDSLNSTLVKIFSNDTNLTWLGWSTNSQVLTVDAVIIADQVFPPPGEKPSPHYVTLRKHDPSPNNWGTVWLWAGEKLLNPYTISTTNISPGKKSGTIQNNNTTTEPFLELQFNERYVVRSGDEYSGHHWEADSTIDILSLPIQKFWDEIPDVDFSLGYLFAPGTGTNKLSIATIAGSSDIYAQTSLGLPILRYHNWDYSDKQQVTIEINGGFTTDKNFDTVHPNLFLGGGYQGKFPNPLTTTNNLPIYWFGRGGVAMIDQPAVDQSNVLFKTSGGLSSPKFETKWAPSLGSNVVVPISQQLDIQLGGNVYLLDGPAQWNITLGVSVDLGKFSQNLGSMFGL